MQKQITVSQILEDLENGMTRTPSDKRYNSEVGSIMEKYNLTKFEVTLLFKNEKLKGKKTKQPRQLSFILVDDTENLTNILIEDDTENRNVESPSNNVVNNVEEPSPEIIVAVNSMTGQEVQEVKEVEVVEENNDQLGW